VAGSKSFPSALLHRTRVSMVIAGLGLAGLAAAVSWLLAIAAIVAGGLVWLGYQLAGEQVSRDRAWVATQRRVLEAEWRGWESTLRVQEAFLSARRAMQEEALRSTPMPYLRRRSGPTLRPRDVENKW
jgi:hypothetical protein